MNMTSSSLNNIPFKNVQIIQKIMSENKLSANESSYDSRSENHHNHLTTTMSYEDTKKAIATDIAS